ncbi:hypothetical protein WJX73_001702 [Symbiochloris irregularis]|uniref:ASCH domain-containing protein n=1 Tax=Symbiochloris irregularis TaxID=706552 RepID=A0AAW1NXW4_9CHLO
MINGTCGEASASSSRLTLTLHQPWASLLVWGVKRIEGRNWEVRQRGVLWIHAATKPPDKQHIQEMHGLYRRLHADDSAAEVQLPTHYPVGALVGCVRVVGCLRAEEVEHWAGLPENVKEEVGSAWCSLCENPQRLPMPLGMTGQQGLWYLPEDIHAAAVAGLQPPPKGPGVQQPIKWSHFPAPDPTNRGRLPRSQNANKWQSRYLPSNGRDWSQTRLPEEAGSSRSGHHSPVRDPGAWHSFTRKRQASQSFSPPHARAQHTPAGSPAAGASASDASPQHKRQDTAWLQGAHIDWSPSCRSGFHDLAAAPPAPQHRGPPAHAQQRGGELNGLDAAGTGLVLTMGKMIPPTRDIDDVWYDY